MLKALLLFTLLTSESNLCQAPDVAPIQELVDKRAHILQTKLESGDSYKIAMAATRPEITNPLLILALIEIESRYDKRGKSKKGCLGLTQLSRRTAKAVAQKLGIAVHDLYDIFDNILISSAFLDEILHFHRRLLDALTIYNKGIVNWLDNPTPSGYSFATVRRYRLLQKELSKENSLFCSKMP